MDITAQQLSGAGLVLRLQHLDEILKISTQISSQIGWIEILGDNYLNPALPVLDKIALLSQQYSVVLHLTGLSLASDEPLNKNYLKAIDTLAAKLRPVYISDHLCWSSDKNNYTHDLLPFAYTQSVLTHITDKIKQLQQHWQRLFLVENISSYLAFDIQDYTEPEFLNNLAEQADCGILLDINNIYISCQNHGWSVSEYLKKIDFSRVKQIHLAGFTASKDILIDTHSCPVDPAVWAIFKETINLHGPIPTVLEWDQNIPPLDTLLTQTSEIKTVLDNSR